MMARVTKAPLPDAVSIQPSAVNSANVQGRNCDEPAGSPRARGAGRPDARVPAGYRRSANARFAEMEEAPRRRSTSITASQGLRGIRFMLSGRLRTGLIEICSMVLDAWTSPLQPIAVLRHGSRSSFRLTGRLSTLKLG